MALIRVDDGGGHSIQLLEVDSYRFSTFGNKPEDTLAFFKHLPELQFRENDVLLCAPVKSDCRGLVGESEIAGDNLHMTYSFTLEHIAGTHWTWEIISMLLSETPQYMEGNKMEKMIEARSIASIDPLPSPRVLNSHLQYSRLPTDAIRKKVKMVFVVRNPKDMLVSWYNHVSGLKFYDYQGKFENFFNLFLESKLEYGCYFQYLLEWEKVMEENPGQIHLVYYEDLQQNIVAEIERLAKFLGVERHLSVYEEIAKKCSFVEMAKNREYDEKIQKAFYQTGFSFFRKGKVGGWKEWFTVAMNELFDQVWAEKMKDSKLKFKCEL